MTLEAPAHSQKRVRAPEGTEEAKSAVSNKTAKVASKAMSAKAKAAKAVMDAQNSVTEGKKTTRVPKVRHTYILVSVLSKWISMTKPFHDEL